ncbi:unnamed protein product [Prorocentrum cordatum]|uniref:Mechanosensitive ion channel MscS domain-containing protein n=1 Tax=Prorocentrum cordatum TaxID=2364126 RepID=A0ABN9X7D8_9DINO|nr:unnamed protein product [Polarella glacialis]|mmetsp:Transcript_31942/g.84824  ORF Transcript_31942/g.84824 Transcript_31942/m.84824 type:complete len:489 (+) Transcript_31942:67-1533(+)
MGRGTVSEDEHLQLIGPHAALHEDLSGVIRKDWQHKMKVRLARNAWILFIAAFISHPILLALFHMYGPPSGLGSLITDSSEARSSSVSMLLSIPLAAAFFYAAAHQVISNSPFFDNSIGTPPEVFKMIVILALSMCRKALKGLVSPQGSWLLDHSFFLILVIGLNIWFAVLDRLTSLLESMGRSEVSIMQAKPAKKMYEIMQAVGVTRTGQPEKDMLFSFEGDGQDCCSPRQLPDAKVDTSDSDSDNAEEPVSTFAPRGAMKCLAEIWSLYSLFAKVVAIACVGAYFLEMETTSHAILATLGLSTFGAGAIAALQFGPAAASILRIAIYRPYFVGDIVSVNGNMATTGFVEAITIGGLVIRNFEMKQTWIPHSTVEQATIQNWTRRPTKTVLIDLALNSNCDVSVVKELVKFGKQWIENSNQVLQTGYKKCVVKSISTGYGIQIIFFPAIGVSHKGIRQAFLFDFMKEAHRLRVTLVPVGFTFNFDKQ